MNYRTFGSNQREDGASLIEVALILPLILLLFSGGLFLAFVFLSVGYTDTEIDKSLLELSTKHALKEKPVGVTCPSLSDEPCATIAASRESLKQNLRVLLDPDPDALLSLPDPLPLTGEPNPEIIISDDVGSAYVTANERTPISGIATIQVNLGFFGTYFLKRKGSLGRYLEPVVNSGNSGIPTDCAGNPVWSSNYANVSCICPAPLIVSEVTGQCHECTPPYPFYPSDPHPSGAVRDAHGCWAHPPDCTDQTGLLYLHAPTDPTIWECRCPAGFANPPNPPGTIPGGSGPSGLTCACPGRDVLNPGFDQSYCASTHCGVSPTCSSDITVGPVVPPSSSYSCSCACGNTCANNVIPSINTQCECIADSTNCPPNYHAVGGNCECNGNPGDVCPTNANKILGASCNCICDPALGSCPANTHRNSSTCQCVCNTNFIPDPTAGDGSCMCNTASGCLGAQVRGGPGCTCACPVGSPSSCPAADGQFLNNVTCACECSDPLAVMSDGVCVRVDVGGG